MEEHGDCQYYCHSFLTDTRLLDEGRYTPMPGLLPLVAGMLLESRARLETPESAGLSHHKTPKPTARASDGDGAALDLHDLRDKW